MSTPQSAYRTVDAEGVRAYVAKLPHLAARLGGNPADWTIREVSDGNLNMVFLAHGPNGGLCLKQALPHVRVDPSWKMPLDRTFFEASYLREVFDYVPDLTTECLHFDPEQFILSVESLAGHTVLRTALMNGTAPEQSAAHVGLFVARSTFHTSLFANSFEKVIDQRILFARNQTLTRITVDLVLTDPYIPHPRNHWAETELTAIVADIRTNQIVKTRVDELRLKFLSNPQALLHGDLHTGSVMATQSDTRVIDGEFATYGPIGFDVGLFMANLFLSLAAQETIKKTSLQIRMIEKFWISFESEFLKLWMTTPKNPDPSIHYYEEDSSSKNSSANKKKFIQTIFQDALGYCATEIIRRIIGYAHVADFSALKDHNKIADRKKTALLFAKNLLIHGNSAKSLGDVFEIFFQNIIPFKENNL
ncbi:S-methyl-5-thioribose kinase [Acetobacter cibinongensis]|uniref:S-methyl-5-thioribose kinase n=1 Tax=Acetobacter cibinongensis TaxID=146475 RepID=UPI000A39A3DC|nr:S-methyl-5-thioribose kinase [Acetobacter cibinongensis]